MKGRFLSVAVAVVILAVSPILGTHAAARVADSGAQATADLKAQSFQVAQTGESAKTLEPKQSKSAEPKAARTKALRRAYAIRARIAKQKAQHAKSKKPSVKPKKKVAT